MGESYLSHTGKDGFAVSHFPGTPTEEESERDRSAYALISRAQELNLSKFPVLLKKKLKRRPQGRVKGSLIHPKLSVSCHVPGTVLADMRDPEMIQTCSLEEYSRREV